MDEMDHRWREPLAGELAIGVDDHAVCELDGLAVLRIGRVLRNDRKNARLFVDPELDLKRFRKHPQITRKVDETILHCPRGDAQIAHQSRIPDVDRVAEM